MINWQVPPSRRAAFVAVLAVLALGLGLAVAVDYRPGAYVVAGSLVLAALLRATLAPQYCLGLLVRSRWLDVTTCLALAGAIVYFAATIPGRSR